MSKFDPNCSDSNDRLSLKLTNLRIDQVSFGALDQESTDQNQPVLRPSCPIQSADRIKFQLFGPGTKFLKIRGPSRTKRSVDPCFGSCSQSTIVQSWLELDNALKRVPFFVEFKSKKCFVPRELDAMTFKKPQ